MKTIFFALMLVLATCVGFLSCTEDDVVEIPTEVTFKLDYSFVESGSMSRATNDEVYFSFYENYIKTKQLTPKSYSLTFTNKTTGAVATINGLWDNKDGIRLPEGEYEVTGISEPQNNPYPSDTVYLSFKESVNIQKDMESLNLTAIYDSFLLMLDGNNYKKVSYNAYDATMASGKIIPLSKMGSNYILFVESFYNYKNHVLQLTRNDKQTSTIELKQIPFEKGKYYYFNDITNSFDIPPMESGN